jgi:Ca2+/Na+ antiporter
MAPAIPMYILNGLGLVLMARLLLLRLHHNVYRVFCLYLAFDLFGTYITVVEKLVRNPKLDYRVTWIGMTVVWDILSLWMVYALLSAILANYVGILRFSRKLLNIALVLAVLIALSTAKPEYAVSAYSRYSNPIDRGIGAGLVLDRVVAMAALLVLLSILGFMLWWPVRMPRNLAVFSIGFILYFSLETGLRLLESFWSHAASHAVDTALNFIFIACFVYWAIFINSAGEKIPVKVGHIWHAAEQKRLLDQLEAMNTALLRAAAKR